MEKVKLRFDNFWERNALWMLVAAVSLAFLPSLSYEFLPSLDDALYVTNYRFFPPAPGAWREIWSGGGVLDLYTPLSQSTYALDVLLWGRESPLPFRAGNILWHIAAALGFYFLQLELRFDRKIAWLLAFAFAVHPMRAESVVWISERKDVLCAAFYLWGLVAALKGKAVVTLLLFVCAMLSKPMAASFPVTAFLLLYFQDGKFKYRVPACSAAAALLYFLWRGELVKSAGSGTPDVRLALENTLFYAFNALFPVDTAPMHGKLEMNVWLLAGICALFIAAAIGLFRKCRAYFLGSFLPMAAAFAVTILPVSGLFSFGSAPRADRYTYLPSVFLLILAGRSLGSLRMAGKILALYAFVLLTLFELYLPVFRNEYTLFSAAVDAGGEKLNPRAAGTLADLMMRRGDFEGAVELLSRPACRGRKDIETRQKFFIALRDGDAAALEELVSSRNDFEFLESIDREYPVRCCSVLAAASPPEKREEFYRKLAEWSSDKFVRCFFRGLIEFDRGNFKAAEEAFAGALRLAPDSIEAKENLQRAQKPGEEQ